MGKILVSQQTAEAMEQERQERPIQLPARSAYRVKYWDDETEKYVRATVFANMVGYGEQGAVAIFKAYMMEMGTPVAGTVRILSNVVDVELDECPVVPGGKAAN